MNFLNSVSQRHFGGYEMAAPYERSHSYLLHEQRSQLFLKHGCLLQTLVNIESHLT